MLDDKIVEKVIGKLKPLYDDLTEGYVKSLTEFYLVSGAKPLSKSGKNIWKVYKEITKCT